MFIINTYIVNLIMDHILLPTQKKIKLQPDNAQIL